MGHLSHISLLTIYVNLFYPSTRFSVSFTLRPINFRFPAKNIFRVLEKIIQILNRTPEGNLRLIYPRLSFLPSIFLPLFFLTLLPSRNSHFCNYCKILKFGTIFIISILFPFLSALLVSVLKLSVASRTLSE